jgi:putative transposase
MKRSRFTETQIVSILNEAEAGLPVKEVCRKHGTSSACYYQWKSKYGGLGASELKRLKELEAENAKLKRLYADMALENSAMKDLIEKSSKAAREARGCSLSGRGTPAVGACRLPLYEPVPGGLVQTGDGLARARPDSDR